MYQQEKTNNTPLSAQLMETSSELYERYLLAALDKDEDLWNAASRFICWNNERRFFVNDFEYALHYPIYMAMRGWRQLQSECGMNNFSSLSEMAMDLQFQHLSAQLNPIIDARNIEEAKRLYLSIQQSISREDALSVVLPTWKTWINRRKLQSAFLDLTRSGFSDADSVIRSANQLRDEILQAGQEEDTCAEFGDGIDQGEQFVERIPLGHNFSQLNTCLGGGLGKTEHIMFVAPTGAGKTVLACQLAADAASTGKQVVLISTEQHSRELEPRIISALGSSNGVKIPFDLIKDGGNYTTILSENQYKAYKRVRETLRGKLHFENWLGSGMSVIDNLEAIVRKREQQYGTIDVLILDWIGGALVSGVSDPGIKRQCYLDAAYTMKEIAVSHNIACVSFAQATADAVGKSKVTEKYLAEAKTMHREAVAAFGISAMRITDSEEDSASYADTQYVYCFKSRKAIGRFFQVKRNFALQRFENM